MNDTEKHSSIHNELVPQLMRQIITASNGDWKEAMVITESVAFGMILTLAADGHAEKFVDAMAQAIKLRLNHQKGKLQ